jgi:hypothetical protein
MPQITDSIQNRITARHSRIGQFAALESLVVPKDELEGMLAAELLEYKLLLDIGEFGGPDSTGGVFDRDEKGVNRIYVFPRRKMMPPGAVRVPGEEVLRWFSGNSVSRLPREVEHWRSNGLWLPKGARISLGRETIEGRPVPRLEMRISLPGSFDASIQIECRGSVGSGFVPRDVALDKAESEHIKTYTMIVTMRSHFDWLSAASPDMAGYKKWISFVFDVLEKLNSDGDS